MILIFGPVVYRAEYYTLIIHIERVFVIIKKYDTLNVQPSGLRTLEVKKGIKSDIFF